MSKNAIQTEVIFHVPGDSVETRISLTGGGSGLLNDSDKLRKLLELLGLPEGATARVLYTTDDVIVR